MFICFEGGDGCGKSTQQKLLAEYLQKKGIETVLCNDPGGTPLGYAVRDILLHRDDISIDDRSEMFLFMAARAQLVEEIIRPALEKGKTVLSDRFLLSNIVYQGYAGGVGIETLQITGQIATGGVMPDLTLIFDLPYQDAVKRMFDRGKQDRMERKGERYHQLVREGFLQYAESHSEQCHLEQCHSGQYTVIDAAQPVKVIAEQVQRIVDDIAAL
ncbi:thymidylate kinase [Planctomycetales bacterium]|nr:thymidylate kinase [Planctomycetales bacterium]